ncbi:MAG: L-threonylcarbamoyladenylate synthase [Clostridium fessum]
MQNETKKELHTQMWKIENPKDFTAHDREVLEKAAKIIRAGGLVAFPTETVYGYRANALDEAAAKKIYAAKGRPSDNPLIAHVSCLEEIAPLVSNMPENGKKLAKAYWPGPMTMVFPKSAIVPYGTTGGLDTVAIRMPSDPIAARVNPSVRRADRGSGVRIHRDAISPTRADHVLQDMDGKIDAIIDGGPVGIGLESTIVDVTGGNADGFKAGCDRPWRCCVKRSGKSALIRRF